MHNMGGFDRSVGMIQSRRIFESFTIVGETLQCIDLSLAFNGHHLLPCFLVLREATHFDSTLEHSVKSDRLDALEYRLSQMREQDSLTM